MQLAIYRIVQEALTNTLKHAGSEAPASRSRSPVPATRSSVEVSDNGTSVGGAGIDGGARHARHARAGGRLRRELSRPGRSPEGGWRVRDLRSTLDACAGARAR